MSHEGNTVNVALTTEQVALIVHALQFSVPYYDWLEPKRGVYARALVSYLNPYLRQTGVTASQDERREIVAFSESDEQRRARWAEVQRQYGPRLSDAQRKAIVHSVDAA